MMRLLASAGPAFGKSSSTMVIYIYSGVVGSINRCILRGSREYILMHTKYIYMRTYNVYIIHVV